MTAIATTSATETAATAVGAANAIVRPIVTRATCSRRTSTCHVAVSVGQFETAITVYEIDGTESRMLASVGAFRVVAESDLHDSRDDTRKAQRHLEGEGLLQTSPLSSDDRAVVLSDRARDLLVGCHPTCR
jgi:hypothetical protein